MSGDRQRIASGSPYEERFGFTRAVRVGDQVKVAGTAPIWPDGSCDPDPVFRRAAASRSSRLRWLKPGRVRTR